MTRVGTELWRKAVHLGFGAFAILLRWLTPWQAALVALAALLFNLFLLHRLTGGSLLREEERERGFSRGIALYPGVVLVLIVVFHARLELAAAVWGLIAVGDGMAGLAGVLVGGPRLPWNPRKSWAGLAAFVLWGTVAAAFLLRWTQLAVIDGVNGGGAGAADWIGRSFIAAGAAIPDPLFLILGCLAAATAAGLAESLDTGVDDNILVPLVGGAVLFAATLVEPARIAAAADLMGERLAWGAAINAFLALAALAARGVDRSGAVVGWVLGTGLFAFGGWRGLLMLAILFGLGTATTKAGSARKEALGLAQERGGRRGARNALANVSAGLGFAFLAVATPYGAAMSVAMVAAFATATCDTVSSEIGQAYGRRHVLITTFRRVRPGTDGAISLEGTLGGWAGAAIVAAAAMGVGLVDSRGSVAVLLGAVAGATFESWLDAVGADRLRLNNEVVNLANTVVGALVALAIYAGLGAWAQA